MDPGAPAERPYDTARAVQLGENSYFSLHCLTVTINIQPQYGPGRTWQVLRVCT
jgi:hypothetical protein